MKRILFTFALLASATPAHADDKCKDAYQVGKDIARLEAEVRELRALLENLLAQRTGTASIEPSDDGIEPAPSEVAPPPPRRSSTKKKRGSIRGTVRGTKGAAYVYIRDIRGKLQRGKQVIAQSGRQFNPRWMVIRKGTTIEFPNKDNIYHNVFSNSPYASFDLGIYRKGDDAKSFRFMRPGLIDVFCNMHAKMTAEVLVVPNRYYAKVGGGGKFSLEGVPPGRHEIVAWGPGMQPTASWVDVPAGDAADVQLSLSPRSKGRHLNKDGKPYGSY